MPSRRKFLRRIGGVAALGVLAGSASYFDVGVVRTKVGGGFGDTIDFESPDSKSFVPPADFTAYADRMRKQHAAALPWTKPRSLTGEFVGTYAQQVDVVPSQRFAVQDAAVLVHRLDDARYQLRLWSAGRLLGKKYDVDPWGYYQETPAFTWLEQKVEAERDDQLSANRSLTASGGRVTVAGATATVPDGSFEMGLADDARYRSRWDGFRTDDVLLVGGCEVSFANGEQQRLDWTLSNGVGVRTPF